MTRRSRLYRLVARTVIAALLLGPLATPAQATDVSNPDPDSETVSSLDALTLSISRNEN